MDAPGQEPSVTLLDWSSGRGTARFWAVKLVRDVVAAGDELTHAGVAVEGADAGALFAGGVARPGGARRVLLINKRNAWATVNVTCGGGAPCACVSVTTIDERTGLEPARTDACAGGGAAALELAPYAMSFVLVSA
jgi:hypothetical protein